MRRILILCLAALIADLCVSPAMAQVYTGGGPGGGGQGGMGGAGMHGGPPDEGMSPSTVEVKPEKAAAKAYAAGTKTMIKAHALEEFIATATDPDKKGKAIEKLDDLYGKALDEFTEVIRNKNDNYDAWNQVGYVHLRLGAYREAVDDYNHTLQLKPDLAEANEHRGEAYLGIDHLGEAEATYMDLFFHQRPLADQLMAQMQIWLQSHRTAAAGVRPADIDSFDKWLQDRDGIAKTTASLPN